MVRHRRPSEVDSINTPIVSRETNRENCDDRSGRWIVAISMYFGRCYAGCPDSLKFIGGNLEWPILPNRTRQIASISAFHENQLECFELMVRWTVAVAVPASFYYCLENRLDTPPWLLAAATELLCDLLKREKSNKRGRSCGFVARHRQDTIDYARWDLVAE